MCGIAGDTEEDSTVINTMLDKLAHRGPDGKGIRGMHGHVRLALVDLSEDSSQPFVRNRSILSFNGELWNYKELRSGLEGIRTTGDTEVLAAMLEKHGLGCLPLLDGMFAFAWSSGSGERWLVKDAFGKIPLYVAKTTQGFIWASERKAFPRALKPIAVPPGSALNLNTGEWVRWYEPPTPKAMGPSQLLDLLRVGVRKRLEADAPVCCLISGGLDSSLILKLASEVSEVTAFTAVFDPQSSDLASARRMCATLGVKLVEVPVSLDDNSILEALRSIEIASKAQIEIACLCLPLAKRIASEGFKACLSGEAADELFGGYGNFCIAASRTTTDSEVRELRSRQVSKMGRGNFIRCNKVFMAHGVECRLPFMEQTLVESAIHMDLIQSPPGKRLLKMASRGVVPDWVIKRQKETFQGASGVSEEIASQVRKPVIYYNNELRKQFGYLPKD